MHQNIPQFVKSLGFKWNVTEFVKTLKGKVQTPADVYGGGHIRCFYTKDEQMGYNSMSHTNSLEVPLFLINLIKLDFITVSKQNYLQKATLN